MSKSIVFRFDASEKIGGGHAVRCLNLASALSTYGYDCCIATNKETFSIIPEVREYQVLELGPVAQFEADEIFQKIPNGCDVLVIDHFHRGSGFEKQCRSWSRNIVVVDGQLRGHDCDLLIDPNLGRFPEDYRTLLPAGCRILSGSDYAMLRPSFAQHRHLALGRNNNKTPSTILINFGAGDTYGLVKIVLEGLTETGFYGKVLLTGKQTEKYDELSHVYSDKFRVTHTGWVKDLAPLLSKCDLMIGAGGASLWEAFCLGMPVALVKIADNQTYAIQQACKTGAALYIGEKQGLAPRDVTQALTPILTNSSHILAMKEAASLLCDGRGVERVVTEINKLVNNNILDINKI